MIKDFLYFIVIILSKTIIDLFRLFGSIIIFGFVLYAVSSITRRIFAKTLGSKTEVYITGWIGTPIHELSHALFCLIFRHKINDIKLFNTKSDTIGYVLHSYDSRSWYQQMGNFFIGVAPIIVGTLIVYFLFALLAPELEKDIFTMHLPENRIIFNSDILSMICFGIYNMFAYAYNIFTNIINNVIDNCPFKSIAFWIFLYLSVSIASHMELSPADISHAWKGIIIIFALSLIINTFLIFIKIFLKVEIPVYIYNFINKILDTYNMLLIFSVIISLLNFFISYIILTPINLIRKGCLINPFSN
ncbi:hypothetical protein [uncultured Brachyspira sp.]|uniref:hypothetical protein n=1 Tax=uncultured Brachyspira sp. TaxID=221953 RepID=UPI0025F3E33A|nr:hypothetical protein [uncultured Brachyspira sp.]